MKLYWRLRRGTALKSNKIIHGTYVINKFPGQGLRVPDEGDPANFEFIVGNASV